KFPSFYQHPFHKGVGQSPIPKTTYHEYFLERHDMPSWPALSGVAWVPHADPSSFTLFQLDETGSLYAQSHSYTPNGNSISNDVLLILDQIEFQNLQTVKEELASQPADKDAEACHEVLEIGPLFPFIQDCIARDINQEPAEETPLATHPLFKSIESLHDAAFASAGKILYQTFPSRLPSLRNSERVLEDLQSAARLQCPATGEIEVRRLSEEISGLINSLPGSRRSFQDGTRELALAVLESDLRLDSTVLLPRSGSVRVLEDNGSHAEHRSMVESILWEGAKEYVGVPSWLYSQWDHPAPFASVLDEADDGVSSGRSGYSNSEVSETPHVVNMARSASGHGARPARPHSQPSAMMPSTGAAAASGSSLAALPSLASRLTQSQPQIVIASSQPRPSQPKPAAKKRKMGF
ncbi:hypothetical protein HDU91_001802, partial [Kappamyces sp. JEL0680]